MAKWVLEIPEGYTNCTHCPCCDGDAVASRMCEKFDCDKYDLSQMILTKIEDDK